MMLSGFSPFAPREQDIRRATGVAIAAKAPESGLPETVAMSTLAEYPAQSRTCSRLHPLDCARCGRWLVQSPAFHKTLDGYVCWPLCEDA